MTKRVPLKIEMEQIPSGRSVKGQLAPEAVSWLRPKEEMQKVSSVRVKADSRPPPEVGPMARVVQGPRVPVPNQTC